MISPRRIKQVQALTIFTSILSFAWFLLSRSLGQVDLSQWILGAAIVFALVPFLLKRELLILARVLYLVTLNVSVTVTASYVGQPGNVEFVLMFALALPFLMFSFRREMPMVIIFSVIPLVAWFALFFTDFNLVTTSKMDVDTAMNMIYPFSLLSTFILVGFQTTYFSYLNASYYNRVHDRRIEAEEASTAKSRFLSTMSHEIRTPLNAIIGLSHILQDSKPREDQVDNVEALNYSGKLLLQLLNNVLDFSKMEADELELDPIPTDLNLAFRQLNKIHEPNCLRKGIFIKVEIDDDIPMLWLDVVRFNQVLNNLINNAIKFTDEGGVTVRLKKTNEVDNEVGLRVEVSDTGKGIADDKQDDIFEAFKQEDSSTQRVYGGTGLGLSIVKKIIEVMGSEVSLDSELGKGSTFHFELSLPKVSGSEIAKLDEKAVHNLKGVRVLLVEDNAINELVGRQILEKEGMKVDSASDGSIAVDKAKENEYDIILMDIQMPVMDGYTASKKIREFDTEIPIMALSASVFMEAKDHIYNCGMNGFIFKPFNPDNLFEEIEKAVKN